MILARLLFLVFLMLLGVIGNAQYSGGAPEGYAGAGLNANDHWSLLYNQAGMAHLTSVAGGVFYTNRFGLKELSEGGAVVALPVGSNVFGLTFSNFGFGLFSEGRYGLAYARKLSEKLNVGVQFNYFNSTVEGQQLYTAATVDGGFQYLLSDQLQLAVHIVNPRPWIGQNIVDFSPPTILRGGVKYAFSEQVFVTAEIHKDLDFDPSFKGGFEYHPNDLVYIRAGLSTNPFQSHFGLGFHVKQFLLDVSTAYQSDFGIYPQIALSYRGE